MTSADETYPLLHTGRRHIWLLILVYLLLGVIYSFATPVFEASDEIWHYPVVREIRNQHQLPVQTPGEKTDWAQEGSQPPLYYTLAALLTIGVDDGDYEAVMIRNPFVKAGIPGTPDNVNFIAHPPGQGPWQGGTVLAVYLIRWLSLLMGAGTVYFSWRLARTVYPRMSGVALLAAAIVAFNPMTIFINASVNNDALMMLLTTATLWLLADELMAGKPGVRLGRTLLLGALLGMAALTKVSALMLLPATALALTLVAWRQRDWRSWFVRGIILVLMIGLIAGWWYVRNWQLYGDLFGITRMAIMAGARPEGFGLIDLTRERSSFWYAYWGVFGAFNVLAPQWFFWLITALVIAAAIGLAVRLARAIHQRELATWPTHLTLLTFIVLSMLGIIRWSLLTPASQGRLLFGGVAIIGLYLAIGVATITPQRWRFQMELGVSIALFACALIIPFISIAPSYRPPTPIANLPDGAQPLDARFDDAIHLLGYQIHRPAIYAGEPLEVTLYWQTDVPLTENLDLSLNGFGYYNENVAKLDTWPGGGLLPTSFWQPGVIYPDHYLIATAPNAITPTILTLAIQYTRNLISAGLSTPVAAFGNGKPVGSVILAAGDLRTPSSRLRKPLFPPIALLDDGIRLHAYTISTMDGTLEANFVWSTTQPIPKDYTIFVHLLDQQGNLIVQDDAPPRDGFWPTSHWQPEESVNSRHELVLPDDLPSGEYTILVGMYDPKSGERLAISSVDGVEWPDRAMPIPVTIHP